MQAFLQRLWLLVFSFSNWPYINWPLHKSFKPFIHYRNGRPIAQLAMGEIKIRFIETFHIFRLLKGFTAIWEGSNYLKLSSVEVLFHQTYNFVFIRENISGNTNQTIYFLQGYKKFACLIKANFYRSIKNLIVGTKSKIIKVSVKRIWLLPISISTTRGGECRSP